MYRIQAAAIQQDLARVGIALEVRSQEFATLLGDMVQGQLPDVHRAVCRRDRSRHAAARVSLRPDRRRSGLNRAHYRNADVDRLIDAASAMSDDDQRRLLYEQAQTAIARDVPVVSLWYKTNVAVFQPDIHGVRLSPIADFTFLKDVFRSNAALASSSFSLLRAAASPASAAEPLRSEAALPHDPDRALRRARAPGRRGDGAPARRRSSSACATKFEPVLGVPRGRVQVILVDQTDLSNGWATPVPYDAIEITAVPPSAETLIGNTTDWLELVFTHEYTHILHLDRSRGLHGGRAARVRPRAAGLSERVPAGLADRRDRDVRREPDDRRRARSPPATSARSWTSRRRSGRFEPIDRAGGGLDRLARRQRAVCLRRVFSSVPRRHATARSV